VRLTRGATLSYVESPPDEHPAAEPEAPADEIVRGPHLWINWQAMLAGQEARLSSEGESILFRPVWQEYALYSDAAVSCELEFGPYRLMSTRGDGGRVGRLSHQLVLRSADHLREGSPDFSDDEEAEVSGWTGGTLGDQVAALLALALARRVRCGGAVRQGFAPGDPLGEPTTLWHRTPVLVEPHRAPMLPGIADSAGLGDASELLETYSTLSAEDAAALTRAAGQYADALWWADADPRFAWLKLVSALEAGANRTDTALVDGDPVALLKRHRGQLYGELSRINPDAAEVTARHLARTLGVQAKFLAFTLEHAPEPPASRPQGALVDFDALEAPLKVIYDLRSRDLHDGIPFPWPLCEPPDAGPDGVYERFAGPAVQSQGGTWPATRLPMYLHTFAHIVGGVLRNWWRALPAGAPTAGGSASSLDAVADARPAD